MIQKIAVFLLSLFLLVLVAFGYLLWFANTDTGRGFISEKATAMLDREVEYTGNAGLRAAWPPTFHISGLRVANIDGGRAEDMVDIGRVEVAVSPLPLLIGRVKLPHVLVEDSSVYLERLADGRANWQFGETEEEEPQKRGNPPELGVLLLNNAVFGYHDVPQRIDLAVEGRTEEGNVVASGKGTYLGQLFGLDVQGGGLLEARTADPYPVDATLTVGDTTLHAKGTIQDPTNLGGMDIRLRVRGADASELFPLVGIALLPTPPYDIQGALRYADDVWSFEDFTGVMGKSDLSGNLQWDQSRERPKLTARFVSKKLDFEDLGPLIGLEDDVTEADSPYVIPDVSLDISRLAAMDADVTFTGESVVSPTLPLDNFLLKLALDDSVLSVDPVKFGTADGDISARLRIDARQEPVQIAADFRFARLSLARLTEGVSKALPRAKEADGLIGGTAKLKGQGKSLKQMLSTANGDIGIGMEGGQLSNLLVELAGLDVAQSLGFFIGGDRAVPIRCIIGDFAVADGLMHSRALVMDTTDTNVRGEGTIDLGSEEMKLRIVPQPKDSTLVSLRTPIRVEGTMKQPNVIIEKTPLVARGAGAVVLSTVLTPVAAILAFVEPGLGEDSDCAALVDEMRANTGSTRATGNVPENAPVPPPAPPRSIKPLMQPEIVTHPGQANPVKR